MNPFRGAVNLFSKWKNSPPPQRRENAGIILATGLFEIFQGESWEKRLWDASFTNIATITGLNKMSDVNYGAATQITAWYIGIISAASFSAVSSSDTISSHAGWVEWTDYSGNRPAWTTSSASGGIRYNSTYATVTPTASTSIQGLFIASDNTRGGTSGILDATGVLSSSRAVSSGTPLQLRYTKTLTPG